MISADMQIYIYYPINIQSCELLVFFIRALWEHCPELLVDWIAKNATPLEEDVISRLQMDVVESGSKVLEQFQIRPYCRRGKCLVVRVVPVNVLFEEPLDGFHLFGLDGIGKDGLSMSVRLGKFPHGVVGHSHQSVAMEWK